MDDNNLILIGTAALVCLTPVAVYLLYLSHLNRQTPPTLVPGPRDFAAVLLALSGFLLLSGPLFLTLVHSAWRSYLFGNWAALRAAGPREALAGSLMAVGYLVLLAAAITYLLRKRRPVTAIYNVAPERVEQIILEVVEDLGYPCRQANGRVEIGAKKVSDPPALGDAFIAPAPATVRVDRFPATSHATLRWNGDYAGIRHEVEAILPRALPSPGKTAAASWMFTGAMAVMVAMLLWLVVLIVVVFVPPPT